MRVTKVPLLIVSALAVTMLWQNCGKFKSAEGGKTDGSSDVISPTARPSGYFQKINAEILQAKCVACHSATLASGGVDYTNFSTTLASGSVIASNHAASSLYSTCANGSMPQGGAQLTSDELADISSWIDNGALQNELPVVNAGVDQTVTFSSPGATATLSASATDRDGTIASYTWSQVSGPSTATLSAANAAQTQASDLVVGTYIFRVTAVDDGGGSSGDTMMVNVANGVSLAILNANIFVPKCAACHSNTLASGGYNMSTYAGIKTDVVAGNATGSVLYQRCADNTMPQGGSLSQTEKDQIRDWINQGALFN